MTGHLTGTGIWSGVLRSGPAEETAAAAAELESLGYSALWIPDIGGAVFGAVEHLLTATSAATIATGILNLWMHTAEETAAQIAEPHAEAAATGMAEAPAEPIVVVETPAEPIAVAANEVHAEPVATGLVETRR